MFPRWLSRHSAWPAVVFALCLCNPCRCSSQQQPSNWQPGLLRAPLKSSCLISPTTRLNPTPGSRVVRQTGRKRLKIACLKKDWCVYCLKQLSSSVEHSSRSKTRSSNAKNCGESAGR